MINKRTTSSEVSTLRSTFVNDIVVRSTFRGNFNRFQPLSATPHSRSHRHVRHQPARASSALKPLYDTVRSRSSILRPASYVFRPTDRCPVGGLTHPRLPFHPSRVVPTIQRSSLYQPTDPRGLPGYRIRTDPHTLGRSPRFAFLWTFRSSFSRFVFTLLGSA